ncbi:hypothetical protein D3C80_1129700 [compost metagenome]
MVASVSPVSVRPSEPCHSPLLVRSRAFSARVLPVIRPGLRMPSALTFSAPPLCICPLLVSFPLNVPVNPLSPLSVPPLSSDAAVRPIVAPCTAPAFVSWPPLSVSAPPEIHLPAASLVIRLAVASALSLP